MKMKKTSLVLVAGMALLLAGCGNQSSSSGSKKTDNSPKTETVKKAETKQDTNNQENSNSQVTSDSTNENSNAQSQNKVTQESTQNSGQQNVAQTKQFNDQAQAASYVAAQPGYIDGKAQQGLPTVNLGYGITGTLNSGAGQQELQWNEGNWSFTVRASAVQGQDPTPTAKQIVNELESVYLPAPQNHGVGTFDIATGTYTLTWQKNNKVYSVSGSSPSDVINKAVSAGKSE